MDIWYHGVFDRLSLGMLREISLKSPANEKITLLPSIHFLFYFRSSANMEVEEGACIFDFGTFKGNSIHDVPDWYLTWLCKHNIYAKPRDWALTTALVSLGLLPEDAVQKLQEEPEFEEYDDEYVFDFGQHKGLRISSIPSRYLLWCVRNRVYAGRPLLRRGLIALELLEH